jgi:hypothetical protein
MLEHDPERDSGHRQEERRHQRDVEPEPVHVHLLGRRAGKLAGSHLARFGNGLLNML